MTKPPHFHASQDGDFAVSLNASLGGWSAAMGLHFVHATADEVVAVLEIGDAHRQAYGIVHGGVHSGMIETIASVGAALEAMKRSQSVVGVENHTSFLLAVREGMLRATAHNDLARAIRNLVIGLEFLGNRLAQFRQSRARRVLGEARFQCRDGGRLDVLRRIEIRLARAKAANVDAFGFHRFRLAVDGKSEGGR